MELVDDDELEAGEEAAPPRVMGQQSGVEHVRVGHDDVAALADRGATARRRVPVVRVDADIDRESGFQGAELGQLVLRQGLGRVYIQGAFFRALEHSLKNREVVAKRLSTGGRGDDDQMPAAPHRLVGLGLVRVKALDAAPAECGDQLGAKVSRKRGEGGRRGGNHVIQRYFPWKVGRDEAGRAGHMFGEVRRTFVRSQ